MGFSFFEHFHKKSSFQKSYFFFSFSNALPVIPKSSDDIRK
jgi:hypothetical protein